MNWLFERLHVSAVSNYSGVFKVSLTIWPFFTNFNNILAILTCFYTIFAAMFLVSLRTYLSPLIGRFQFNTSSNFKAGLQSLRHFNIYGPFIFRHVQCLLILPFLTIFGHCEIVDVEQFLILKRFLEFYS